MSFSRPPSLATPGVRMVAVAVRLDPDVSDPENPENWPSETEIISVLALSAREAEGGDVEYESLVLSPDPLFGVISSDALGSYFDAHRVVVAPWPESDDGARLRDVVGYVRDEAVRKARDWCRGGRLDDSQAMTRRLEYRKYGPKVWKSFVGCDRLDALDVIDGSKS